MPEPSRPTTAADPTPADGTTVPPAMSADRHFADFVSAELDIPVAGTRDGGSRHWLRHPPRDLFGVALSGGGIRSATFNLGVLQALHEDRLLEHVDYLATVSGGGYVGGFWTSWLNRRSATGAAASTGKRLVDFPAPDVTSGERDAPSVRHLREFSRFLSPELGIFSVDTGRMLVAALNAIVPSLVLATAFVLSSAVLLAVVFWITTLLAADWMARPAETGQARWLPAIIVTCSSTLMMLLARQALRRRRRITEPDTPPVGIPRTGIMLGLAVATGGAAWVIAGNAAAAGHARALVDLYRGPARGADPETMCRIASETLPYWPDVLSALLFMLYPAGALFAVVAAIALGRAFVQSRAASRHFAIELDTVASWMLLGSGFWTVFGLAWGLAIIALPLISAGLGAASALGGAGLLGLAARVTFLISRRGHSESPNSSRWQRVLLAAIWYVVLALAVIAAMSYVASWRLCDGDHALPVSLGALAITVLGSYLLDPNHLGLHRFYRSRIARAWLGAADRRRDERPSSTERESDDIPLRELLPGAPVHLVCCAANDLSPIIPMVNLSRGAGSAVLSAAGFSVGRHWYTWREHPSPTDARRGAPAALDPTPTLASALTASGAAFNTHMGRFSNEFGRASTFVMSALGLRLGVWLPHPRRWRDGVTTAGAGAFLRDALGLSSLDDEVVFLSDGGHFENTALYELVRRHCRWIIVCDAGSDPKVQFNDLGAAIRRVRTDFAVDIRVNLDPLRPNETGKSRQHVAVGDIHYPDGDTGIIIVVKPSLTGSEPPDVQNYAATHPEFPHQSTADQFFDEAQWESYRRLGQHCLRAALAPIVAQETSVFQAPIIDRGNGRVRRRASALRRHWFTVSVGHPDFAARTAEAITKVNAGLADPAVEALAGQIRRELGLETDTTADPRGFGGVPRDQQLASVSLLRQTLIRFEQIYNEGHLATMHSAPQYLGLMNGMARWMRAPFVRAWWPILQSQSGQGFRDFVAAQFGAKRSWECVTLARVARGQKLPPSVVTIFRSKPGDIADGHLRVVLLLAETDADITGPRLEAARLDYRRVRSAQGVDAIAWLSEDLDVPSSMWGTGLGTALLSQLAHDAEFGGLPHYVVVPHRPSAPFEERKRHADTMQLYSGGGFAPVETARDPLAHAALATLGCTTEEWIVMGRWPT